MKKYRVYDPVFDQEFILCAKCSYKEFIDYVNEYMDEPEQCEYKEDNLAGLTVNTDKAGIMIYVSDVNAEDIDSTATLIHEIHHATEMSLVARRGMDRRELEVPAYYEQFLFREFMSRIKSDITYDNQESSIMSVLDKAIGIPVHDHGYTKSDSRTIRKLLKSLKKELKTTFNWYV